MQFNSYSYLLLLIPAVALFWALPQNLRRWYVLALSLAYYATWNAAFLLVPLALCIGVHAIAGLVIRLRTARLWFHAGIGYVLLFFLFFRYRDFLLANMNAVLSALHASPVTVSLKLAVPLGISFYSFEAISYLIDAKQGRIKSSRFRDLYLFVMFWPHLMAGPIVRFRELVPQLEFAKRFELAMLLGGLDRLILGLVQKNLLANPIGSWVDEGFLPNAIRSNTTIDNWALAVAFGLQIYFDFAAYSNMAIGVSRLIGVTLPENFRFPYHAQNPPDFWNRWHMTLSRWIRDYLFSPSMPNTKAHPDRCMRVSSALWRWSAYGTGRDGASSSGVRCTALIWCCIACGRTSAIPASPDLPAPGPFIGGGGLHPRGSNRGVGALSGSYRRRSVADARLHVWGVPIRPLLQREFLSRDFTRCARMRRRAASRPVVGRSGKTGWPLYWGVGGSYLWPASAGLRLRPPVIPDFRRANMQFIYFQF